MKITAYEINNAKETIRRFDKQKTHNKLDSDNNWIGYLGEKKFKDYISNLNVIYTWNNFLKPDYTKPDFIINGYSVDIKTTYDDALWLQKPEWDIYILGAMERDNSEINFCGWISKQRLKRFMRYRNYKVLRNNRVDYRIPVDKLDIMRTFEEMIKNGKA